MFSKDRLQALRKKHNISQTAIAEHLGVTRSAYNGWEKGKFIPNKKNLEELADYFNVETSYFESEYEIVNRYLQLNDINKQKLLKVANELYFSQLYKYRVHAKLSAGLGNYYNENYEFDTVYFNNKFGLVCCLVQHNMTISLTDGRTDWQTADCGFGFGFGNLISPRTYN